MKTSKIVITYLLCVNLLLIFSCTTSDESSSNNINLHKIGKQTSLANERTSILKILPLGDSRVEGATFNSVSYRYYLWDHLVLGGINFDYIGTQYDNTSYPPLNFNYFDPNHQGIGGTTTIDILNNIDEVISITGKPNVVLLGIGGNDLVNNIPVGNVIANIKQIIQKLRRINPKITIVIEQIAPANSSVMTPNNIAIHNFFISEIKNLANGITNSYSKVIAVDMASNWSDDYMIDNLHYNSLGAKEVALRYYLALKEHILN